MDAASIFMDEIEKIAIAGTPLGRQIKTLAGRTGMTSLLKLLRAGKSPAGGDRASQRVVLSGIRGGIDTLPPKMKERFAAAGIGESGPMLPRSVNIKARAEARKVSDEQLLSEAMQGRLSKKRYGWMREQRDS